MLGWFVEVSVAGRREPAVNWEKRCRKYVANTKKSTTQEPVRKAVVGRHFIGLLRRARKGNSRLSALSRGTPPRSTTLTAARPQLGSEPARWGFDARGCRHHGRIQRRGYAP